MTAAAASSSIVERSVRHARRRLALRVGLVRAGWSVLAGVVLLEVGLAAGAATGVAGAWAPGAVLLALAPALLVVGPRPAPSVAAAVLDARLGAGATLATAVEALEGRHGRFAARVLAEAERALAGRSLRDALPLQAPAGLLLGGAAAALLPAVLLGGGAGLLGTHEAGPAAPTLTLDLRPQAPGGGPATGEPVTDAPAPDPVVVTPAEAEAALGAADPLRGLPPEVAAALRERLEAALAALPPGAAPSTTAGDGATPSATHDDDPLGQALRQGDAAGALRAVDDLARAAAEGDRLAARRLDELARRAARAGAGAGAGVDGADPPPAGGHDPGPAHAWGGLGRERLPLELELASRRYFEAATGAERRARR